MSSPQVLTDLLRDIEKLIKRVDLSRHNIGRFVAVLIEASLDGKQRIRLVFHNHDACEVVKWGCNPDSCWHFGVSCDNVYLRGLLLVSCWCRGGPRLEESEACKGARFKLPTDHGARGSDRHRLQAKLVVAAVAGSFCFTLQTAAFALVSPLSHVTVIVESWPSLGVQIS